MPKTLLLADDSITIQKVVSITFANQDVTLVTVDNGNDAIARAREVQPALILADVVMPGKNGYEVCEAVKRDPALAHVPVVLLSGTFEAFDEERAARIGADGHITKPFEAQALVETVRQLLEAPPAPPAQTLVDESEEADDGVEETVVAETEPPFDFLEAEFEGEAPAGTASTVLDPLDADASDFGDGALTQLAEEREDSLPEETPEVALLPETGMAPEAWDDRDSAGWLSEPQSPLAEASPEPLSEDNDGLAGFDFEFDAPEIPGEPVLGFDEPQAPVSPEDLAQDTLVSPTVADAFAVSSSDLRDPAEARIDALEVTDPALIQDLAPEATRLFSPAPETIPPSPASPEPATRLEMTSEPPIAPERAAPGKPDLNPMLRQQLHETLEKVAWEAFGDLAERIVPQVLEQVEAIAWDVIPRMAEALVEEEIRRLKGEED